MLNKLFVNTGYFENGVTFSVLFVLAVNYYSSGLILLIYLSVRSTNLLSYIILFVLFQYLSTEIKEKNCDTDYNDSCDVKVTSTLR
jgi:hypothetical protein